MILVLTQLLVDLVLDRQAVAVPSEAPADMVASGGRVAGHDILQRRWDAAISAREQPTERLPCDTIA